MLSAKAACKHLLLYLVFLLGDCGNLSQFPLRATKRVETDCTMVFRGGASER
jgi:hypothetical protein